MDVQAESFNKNEKQLFFNQIKGSVVEINIGDDWCSFTINVGHENTRLVNLSIKKTQFDSLDYKYKVGEKVLIKYFLTSRFKYGRWHTTANILSLSVVA